MGLIVDINIILKSNHTTVNMHIIIIIIIIMFILLNVQWNESVSAKSYRWCTRRTY